MVTNKKGVIEVQFNWIFILIVGGIILIFFFSLIMKQSEISKQKISASIAFDMASIFKGAQISKDTEHPVAIPPLDIYFECEPNSMYSSYRVSTSEEVLGNSLVVFSPDKIVGDTRTMITWAKDWNLPFRVMNFLYLTSDTLRYIVIGQDAPAEVDMQKLYDELPDLIQKDFYEESDYFDLNDKNNYKVRIVKVTDGITAFSKNVPMNLAYMKEDDLSMVIIEPIGPNNKNIEGWGKVNFYKKNGSVFSFDDFSYYIGKASLYGAIYSEDVDSYKCNMNKAMQRLGIVTRVYINRSVAMVDYFSSNPDVDTQNCKSYITNAISELTNIYKVPELNAVGTIDLFNAVSSLETQNRLILRYSCPVIY